MKDSFLKIRLSEEEYKIFQDVCDKKNKNMSEVIRSFIDSYCTNENIILLDVDNETLKESINLCREKKIKFNNLIKFLLGKAIKNKDKIDFK